MNFEAQASQSADKAEKEKKYELTADYNNIRERAIELIDQRIRNLGPDSPKASSLEQAITKLESNYFVTGMIENNNWKERRERPKKEEGGNEGIDETLVGELVRYATGEN
jgi:hypothetical protein